MGSVARSSTVGRGALKSGVQRSAGSGVWTGTPSYGSMVPGVPPLLGLGSRPMSPPLLALFPLAPSLVQGGVEGHGH